MVGVVGKTGGFGSQKVPRYDKKCRFYQSQREPFPGKLRYIAYLNQLLEL